MRSLSGFYEVQTESGKITCRGRGGLRRNGESPLTGDLVEISVEHGKGMVERILPRKNSFIRPAVANIDMLVIFAASVNPVTEPFLIDRVAAIAGDREVQTVLCLNKCDLDPAEDLQRIKWFASAEIQIQYGVNVENVLGTGSRYDPANVNALSAMNWSSENVKILTEQLIKSNFEPQIPASYFVGRTLDNAYRAVTIKGENPREALYSYNLDINAEITRKRNELGIKEEVK